MKKTVFLCTLIVAGYVLHGQNDLDMLRYARGGVGGTARFTAMGGAFGAVGADLSVLNYNPAGLAIYRKGDLNFGMGLKLSNNSAKMYGGITQRSSSNLTFNNFGLAAAWESKDDPESRHAIGFSNVQSQNFSTRIQMSGYTNSQSISRDFLNLAEGQTLKNLNNSYEGLAYDSYVIDYDSASQKYFSFIDINRTVLQTRDIVKTGRVNDLNFSYAYTYKDKFYIGASLGFPQVNFSSTTSHTELDDKDSMRVSLTGPSNYTTSYTYDLPIVYASRLGFNSLVYEEYFKTTGSGFNLKLGGIYRVNDILRIGAYYHTATNYRLSDQYQTTMTVSFDKNKSNPKSLTYPENGGVYSYRIKTPAKYGFNLALVLNKQAVLALDYEGTNYSDGSLTSSTPSDFTNVNSTIQKVYSTGHNVRMGVEYNLGIYKLRAGYVMNGNPYGQVFVGDLVRNTFSVGAGYKGKGNFYIDASYALTHMTEHYYLYTTMNTSAKLYLLSSSVNVTMGFKF
jgi:hypothetical protein